MQFWTFWDYITEDHVNPVSDWYGKYLDAEQKATFDALVKALSLTEDWDSVKPKRRKYKELEGKDTGLTQLMFEARGKYMGKFVKKKQFRALGILKRQEREFIFLGGCEKHGFLGYDPPDAFTKAHSLKTQFEQGRGVVNEHRI